MTTDQPSYVICPCGFRAEGRPKEALAGYRAHECALHPPETSGLNWPAVAALAVILAFVAFMCTVGWGLWG